MVVSKRYLLFSKNDFQVTLKDSLENAAFEKQVYALTLKYEVQEKDNKLLQQKLDLKNARIIIFSTLAGIAVLSILAFFILWRNNYQKKVITAQFHRERALEKENTRLRILYPAKIPADAISSEALDEANLTKQLFLNACHLMEEQHLYLDPAFDLGELVKRLNTNRSYLSQAINQYSDDGFRSFLNKYRVQHAKNILWAIAYSTSTVPFAEVWTNCGMNSNQSFYRIFKAMTGLTPKEYLDQVKLELNSAPEATDAIS
jgi:YesN/AraC family two-component response regulator